MRMFFSFIIVFFLLLFPRTIQAQESEWIINTFTSDIQIRKSGEVNVTEKIAVDFFDTEKHGIYRDIPSIYTNDDGSKFHTKVSDISVPGYKKDVSREGDFVRIRIGDPDKTITGKHEYTLSYTVTGVLRGFSEHDELYWNVTGNLWDVPILAASAIVKIDGSNPQEARCFQGVYGSSDTCLSRISGTTAVYTATRSIAPGENMTLVATYPKGITDLPVIQSFSDRLFSPQSLLTFISLFVIGIGGMVIIWSQRGRDLWLAGKHVFDHHAKSTHRPWNQKDTVVVEYTPPEKLRPAEIGVLMDERADTLDVTGTIIDLAARGFLEITEEKKKWVFGSMDYTFTKKQKDTKALLSYENELYTRLFSTGESIKVSSLKKEFYDDLKKVKDQLYRDMVDKGYFPTNPENVRNIYIFIGIAILVVFGILFFNGLAIQNEFLTMGGIAGVLTGANVIMFSQAMPRRTARGAEMYRRIKGYRLFIDNVETYRQQFFEKKNMFNTVLPYAIVFGLTAKFAKSLEKMGVTPDNTTLAWYHGTAAFSMSRFESSMTSFSTSIGSAMTSTPSSSGSGGGGSSGGGFGGGGGGSW